MRLTRDLLSMVLTAAERDPEWVAALDILSRGERTEMLTCKHEKGENILKGKLSDGSNAREYWDQYVVRFKGGIIVGIGSTMQGAWLDALNVANSVTDAVKKRYSSYYGWVI